MESILSDTIEYTKWEDAHVRLSCMQFANSPAKFERATQATSAD